MRTKLYLSERVFTCECGVTLDRDENVAINILAEGMRLLNLKKPDRGLHGSNACGGEGSGAGSNIRVKPAPKKQELIIKSS